MAGVVPFAKCTPGRKQWNIRDKRAVRRLRSQLAEDGCPESQLVLAKQLLQEKSVTNVGDNEENARLGVFWLMQASEQGCQEATEMLQNCLDSGEGITEHNYLDVKTCLNTSLNEKLARRAAREMFFSLSAGQDFITTEQLRRQMSRIHSGEEPAGADPDEDDNRPTGWKRSEHWGEKLTEGHLEEAAATYSRGEVPIVQRVLSLTDPRTLQLTNLPYLHRTVRHPILSLQYAYNSLLDLAWTFVYPRAYGLLIILILCPLESLLMIVPMAMFHGSFLFMVVSTLNMLQAKREYSHFRVWSQLFLSYDRDGHLNTEDPEFVYIKKNLRPYGIFFLSLLIHLALYPIVAEYWIPQSEFAIFSFALTFATLFHFSNGIDFLMLLSFGLHVLAKYPYESDGVVRQTWRFLDTVPIPCFASHVVGSGVEFCLNFRGVFYLLIPGIFIKLASREKWGGTYKVLIPHCVTLAWWQMAILSCQGATLYGLIRSTLALVGLILFLPIVSIATVTLPVFTVLTRITEPGLTPVTVTTTLLASCPLLIGIYLANHRIQYLSKLQVALGVVSAVILLLPAAGEYLVQPARPADMQVETTLTYDQYTSLCPRDAIMLKTSTADIQRRCLHFLELSVHWEGNVEDVKISAVHNSVRTILSYVPEPLRSLFTCMFGEKYDEPCHEQMNEVCELLKQVRPRSQKCHLTSHNRYDVEISVRVESSRWGFGTAPSLVTLVADDSLRNLTLELRPKDRIWFSGALLDTTSLGTNLRVTADEIGCVQCANNKVESQKLVKKSFFTVDQLSKGLNRILNFILNPVVVIH